MNNNSGGGGEDGSSGGAAPGWGMYSPEKEYARMGVPNSSWVHTALNTSYEVGGKERGGVSGVFFN